MGARCEKLSSAKGNAAPVSPSCGTNPRQACSRHAKARVRGKIYLGQRLTGGGSMQGLNALVAAAILQTKCAKLFVNGVVIQRCAIHTVSYGFQIDNILIHLGNSARDRPLT